jgi:hypothetical protein
MCRTVSTNKVVSVVFLENDQKAAVRCLNYASALLASESQELRPGVPLTHEAFLPGGLVPWKARRALAHLEATSDRRSGLASCMPGDGGRYKAGRALTRIFGSSPLQVSAGTQRGNCSRPVNRQKAQRGLAGLGETFQRVSALRPCDRRRSTRTLS